MMHATHRVPNFPGISLFPGNGWGGKWWARRLELGTSALSGLLNQLSVTGACMKRSVPTRYVGALAVPSEQGGNGDASKSQNPRSSGFAVKGLRCCFPSPQPLRSRNFQRENGPNLTLRTAIGLASFAGSAL